MAYGTIKSMSGIIRHLLSDTLKNDVLGVSYKKGMQISYKIIS